MAAPCNGSGARFDVLFVSLRAVCPMCVESVVNHKPQPRPTTAICNFDSAAGWDERDMEAIHSC